METIALKSKLYNVVLDAVKEQINNDKAEEQTKVQVERALLEKIADPSRGMAIDLFA